MRAGGKSDALTAAAHLRASSEKIRTSVAQLGDEATLAPIAVTGAQRRAAAVSVTGWALRHGCEGPGGVCGPGHGSHAAAVLELLRAVGLAADDRSAVAKTDLGRRSKAIPRRRTGG